MTLHSEVVTGLFFVSMLHHQVSSRQRLLPTLCGSSDSQAVPVRFRTPSVTQD